MKKFIIPFIFALFLFNVTLHADTYPLVKVNGKTYTDNQFKTWWHYWKTEKTPFPDTPQPFIDWILLSDEAKALGLDKEPSYLKKLKIFKEVRSLLQLRYDEVEKKIEINPDKLWEFYKKNYAPLYRIEAIISNNQNEIKKLSRKIKNSEDFKKYFEKLYKKKKSKDLGWQRPINIPEEFKQFVTKSQKGDIIKNIKYRGNYFILLIEDKTDASKKDYQKIHRNVAVKFKKSEESRLTEELLSKLKKKYKIKIDWKTINSISPFDNLTEKVAEKVVIKIGDNDLTAKTFQNLLKRDVNLRIKNKKISGEKLLKFKKSIVENSINQTLTTLEGLNRHYENTVMKDIYWFYKRNRLISELESKIILPQIKIDEKDIKNYYEHNQKDFLKPAMVNIAVIQTKDKKSINSAFKRIKKGEDFFEVARDIQFHGALPESRRLDSLIKEMREVIKKMKPGEISKTVKYKDWFFIVKLIKKEDKKLHGFKEVKKSIRQLLYNKKLNEIRENYLKKLRERSHIVIREDVWKHIEESYKQKKKGKAND